MINPFSQGECFFVFTYNGLLVRVAGLEPARGCPRLILSQMRLPFRHTRMHAKARAADPSRAAKMVGAAGFEPTTPSPPD